MYRIGFFLAMLLACIHVDAQTSQLSGSLKDKETGDPVKHAVVMIISLPDSTLVRFTRTDANGTFSINNLPYGNHALLISHPFFAEYVDRITVQSAQQSLGNIPFYSKSKMLEAVIVKTGGAIRIKGDTTVYTADSFNVSANANVEELLKKLPGIQVDKNGEIKAMGEKVQKVLVDGEEFFGDDPGMAVKNIRADAVKEVQVFDKKSEQAAFTGIDDGKTQKTINLKLKEDKKRGYFGKIGLSGGYAPTVPYRFNNNLMFGSFKGNRKIAGFVLNGNTGQDGLSWQDNQRFGSSDDNSFEMTDEDGIFNISFNRGGSDEDIYIDPNNGFIRNVNAGVQYSNKWRDAHTFNFNPKYNEQDYDNVRNSFTRTQLGDSVLNETGETETHIDRYNIKNSLIHDWKIDSANSLKLTLRHGYYHSESTESDTAYTNGATGNLKNARSRDNRIISDKNAITANIIFKHRFRKARRTLSWNVDWNQSQTDVKNYLQSYNAFAVSAFLVDTTVDQLSTAFRTSGKLSSKLSYTEPISKYWSGEISYELSVTKGINNQITYIKSSPSSGKYDVIFDSLTNDFKQNITVHTPATRFSYSRKKVKFNIGSGFGITSFDFTDRTDGKQYPRSFVNIFPSATFVYAYKSNHSFRIKYNGYNTQPTINQLQPLNNNTNLFNQVIGNPDLKASFASNINLVNNGYDFLKEKWSYQSLSITFTQNAITYNRVVSADSGTTISKPINTDGNVNINFWSGLGFKHKKSQISYQIMPMLNYSRFADVINNQKSFSNTYTGGVQLTASRSKSNKYDFTLSNNINYNYNTNAQSPTANKFVTNTLSLNASIYYKKVWSLVSDYDFNYRQQTSDLAGDINNHVVNVQLQRTFKNNEYTVYVRVRDLLNQNIGIDRNFFGNTFTEQFNQRLQRYFMIGFSWDFKNKAVTSKK